MTLGELKNLLDEHCSSFGPHGDLSDVKIRIAFQPSWPLQYHLDDKLVVNRELQYENRLHEIINWMRKNRDHFIPDGSVICVEDTEDSIEYAFYTGDPIQGGSAEYLFSLSDEDVQELCTEGLGEQTVYLAEAGQVSNSPYLPGNIKDKLGW